MSGYGNRDTMTGCKSLIGEYSCRSLPNLTPQSARRDRMAPTAASPADTAETTPPATK